MATQTPSEEETSTPPDVFSAYAAQLRSSVATLRTKVEQIDSDERKYIALQETLTTYPRTLTREAIVQIGPRALVTAQVVHTNEIYTAVGDGYIIQQSAYHASQMAGRRAECMN
ncbi:hypothetical protein V1517DRAFT_255672 [Lipomyces orientalis]|uniref:Uncharacterized protein n=1 Tax=Lipomyces orientalis TaxID=1233043 RepID=A0ACC3TUF5_9ASCO